MAMAMAMASSLPPPASASHSPPSLLLLALAALGALSLLDLLRRSSCWLWRHFLRPGKALRRYGSWALVTGCTDGIGRSFAMELARRGLNLLLVARSREKAERLAADIGHLHSAVQVQVVVLDLAAPAEAELEAGLARVEETVAGLDLGILINNAGISYPYARFFHEVDPELTLHLLRINVHAMVRMVQIVLPGMLKRRRGAILNLGSGSASVLPSDPLYTLYTATKGFIEKFSRSLYVEYKKKGIDVQCQVPMHVTTKLASIRRPTLFAPSPDAYAKSALRWIGYEPVCSPYWTHSVMWGAAAAVPAPLLDALRLRQSIAVRKRGKAKDARRNPRPESSPRILAPNPRKLLRLKTPFKP